jgi:hypothetical protein
VLSGIYLSSNVSPNAYSWETFKWDRLQDTSTYRGKEMMKEKQDKRVNKEGEQIQYALGGQRKEEK